MTTRKTIVSVALGGIWITLSEFFRNEFLFKSYWTAHYASLGLRFETLPVNGVLWMIWSFVLAYMIFRLLERFSFWQAIGLVWLSAFVMMWITLYNLQVLPMGLLMFAVPLSLIEVAVAGVIIEKYR